VKKQHFVALYQHFDSRGGTTGIILPEASLTNLLLAHRQYVSNAWVDSLHGEAALGTVLEDFAGVIKLWVPEDALSEDQFETIFNYGGKYHIVFGKYGFHNMAEAELVLALEEPCEPYEFEEPEHIEDPTILDDDFGEDAFGLILEHLGDDINLGLAESEVEAVAPFIAELIDSIKFYENQMADYDEFGDGWRDHIPSGTDEKLVDKLDKLLHAHSGESFVAVTDRLIERARKYPNFEKPYWEK
jgi:hypothetical protein